MTQAPEKIFEGTLAKDWVPVLEVIQEHGDVRSTDPIFRQAVDTFITAFLSAQKGPSFTAPTDAAISERILLFHSANRIKLRNPDLQMLVHRSLHYWQSDTTRSIGLAKLLPNDSVCMAILAENVSSEHSVSDIAISERGSEHRVEASPLSALLPLFRSKQEEEFYHAVRSFYPQQLVGVNVSIHAIVNVEMARERLTKREMSFFFKGLLDTVVYNSDDGFRPMIAFEIDSPLHDDQNQIERDVIKDRILALAGLRLVRIRPAKARTNRRQFLALLRNANIAK